MMVSIDDKNESLSAKVSERLLVNKVYLLYTYLNIHIIRFSQSSVISTLSRFVHISGHF